MCGILGVWQPDTPIDPAAFTRAVDSLAFRGPDGRGERFLAGGSVALGHRRLAIIDPSAGGAQPMTNEDGTVWLTFNGEIFNYRALRAELVAAGHRFASQSDSEVLVHGYEEWGTDLPRRLRGMFAFALWDERQRQLLLVRDQLGIKPLYYQRDPAHGRIAFASQPRALFALDSASRQLDVNALSQYFELGYVPGNECIYLGCRKLPPAHWLLVRDGRPTLQCYWTPSLAPAGLTFADAAVELRAHLERAVESQLVSDVGVGGLLSGGLDSSVICGLAARREPQFATFTLGFEDPARDERSYARIAAEHFGTAHHEGVLKFDDARGLLRTFIEIHDEPFADHSTLPTYEVARLARQSGTKVLLSGDGGDELFTGYWRYDRYADARRGGPLVRWLCGRPSAPADAYFPFVGFISPAEQAPLWSTAWRAEFPAGRDNLFAKYLLPDVPDTVAARWCDLKTYLPGDILTKVDRATMACGVEARPPLLDLELVEFALRLPEAVNYRRRQLKSLFRQVATPLLPPALVTPRKQGFSMPLQEWLGAGLLPDVNFILEGSLVARGILSADGVRKFFSNTKATSAWALGLAELWARRWLEDEADPLTTPAPATHRSSFS